MNIREETPGDITSLYNLNIASFDTSSEAILVDKLRNESKTYLSLVAEKQDQILGHILFTQVNLPEYIDRKIAGLAPMAVLPKHQNKGIGSALVQAGLDNCKKLGFGAVVVLGHTSFYSRFGFSPSSKFGFSCEYEVPEEAFMAIELKSDYLKGVNGIIKYHAAFNNL